MPYSAATDPFCHNGHQLPSLFLVGAMKCGTTSLAQQLFDEYGAGGRKKATVRVVVHGGEAGARTKKKLKIDAAALATLDELLDAVRSELPPPKGRRADLGRVRVTIEDAEGGTVEVEDDGDMADAADARCVHVRGWPL